MAEFTNTTFEGRNVVLGVSGGIAVYKAVEVASRLKKLGVETDVIMTENAAKFVSPLTFRSITHRPVVTDMFEEPDQWDIKHISLAAKADLFVIAPATANIIGKLACGIADDMLSTTVMATTAPVLIVPAMNFNMYANPVVQQNIKKLKDLGYIFMEPDTGRMAEGSSGKGRLPEPSAIVEEICGLLQKETGCKKCCDGEADTADFMQCGKQAVNKADNDLDGLRILVTAGPTREPIDPVRYISNRSSGKMGYSVAGEAAERGAKVILVSGPVSLECPPGVELVNVLTAQEMHDAVFSSYEDCDVIIMIAAVADYRCAEIADRKIKKKSDEMIIKLEKNPDILKELGAKKGDRLLVGSCAETNDVLENALGKIKSKNLDLIIANDVTMEGAGFEVDTNIINLIRKDGSMTELPLMSKKAAANEILDEVLRLYSKGNK
ncbi:MAG: bifunctional phosphopantothenoylcysteine decarboxylase/phosphopantothenate--cysteine ligase CoaBC [Clostridiales bacterium]|nr:bifunctional phosphopantothenoylcysteine decarboxylase/phosphopantothenate--cysteine ligase CoaBC [Clostridiales bacterium]